LCRPLYNIQHFYSGRVTTAKDPKVIYDHMLVSLTDNEPLSSKGLPKSPISLIFLTRANIGHHLRTVEKSFFLFYTFLTYQTITIVNVLNFLTERQGFHSDIEGVTGAYGHQPATRGRNTENLPSGKNSEYSATDH
jgi:hypothetical protein